jgi:hypothetical protein
MRYRASALSLQYRKIIGRGIAAAAHDGHNYSEPNYNFSGGNDKNKKHGRLAIDVR